MGMLGFAVLGIVLGAAGTEFLHANKPELIEKVESAAKRFIDSMFRPESDNSSVKIKKNRFKSKTKELL